VSLEIVWPSGKKETFGDIKPDNTLTLEEGKGIVSAQPISFSGASATGPQAH
jgi:hypothetical protein